MARKRRIQSPLSERQSEEPPITINVAPIPPDATKFIVGLFGSFTGRAGISPLLKDLFELLARSENLRD
jgi:hypothetical protein